MKEYGHSAAKPGKMQGYANRNGMLENIKRRPLASISLLFTAVLFLLSVFWPKKDYSTYLNDENIALQGYVLRQKESDGRISFVLKPVRGPKTKVLCYLGNTDLTDGQVLTSDTTENPGNLGKARCATYIKNGMYVVIEGQLSLPDTAHNPGNFDAASYYRTQGIELIMYNAKVVSGRAGPLSFLHVFYRMNTYLTEVLNVYFDAESAGIMEALLTGDKSDMQRDTSSLYKRGGILHVLALSGLHVSLMSDILRYLLMPLYRKKRTLCLIGPFIIWCWCFLAFFPVGMVRAAIMYSVRTIGELFDRESDHMTGLAIACFLLMLQNPYVLSGAAMQYSFLAVLGIYVLRPYVPKSKAISASLSATVFTYPVTLYNYFAINPYQILVNFLILPVVPFLLGFGLGTVLFGGWFAPASELLSFLAEIVLKYMRLICEMFALLPGSYLVTGRPAVWKIILYYVCILGFLLLPKKAKKKLPFWCLMLCLTALLAHPSYQKRIVFADVGQGDCILLTDEKGHAVLIDCGSSSEDMIWQYRIEPLLLYYGIGKLDAVMLSHADKDHVSGIAERLTDSYSAVSLGNLYLPKLSDTRDAFSDILTSGEWEAVFAAEKGDAISVGMINMYCLYPCNFENAVGNEQSAVWLSVIGSVKLLLTGDIDMNAEEELVNLGIGRLFKTEDTVLLKVAHHGSRYSSGSLFLASVKPDIAVIEVGRNNYGHPHPDTLSRLSAVNARVYTTKESGAVVFVMKNKTWWIKGSIKIKKQKARQTSVERHGFAGRKRRHL